MVTKGERARNNIMYTTSNRLVVSYDIIYNITSSFLQEEERATFTFLHIHLFCTYIHSWWIRRREHHKSHSIIVNGLPAGTQMDPIMEQNIQTYKTLIAHTDINKNPVCFSLPLSLVSMPCLNILWWWRVWWWRWFFYLKNCFPFCTYLPTWFDLSH